MGILLLVRSASQADTEFLWAVQRAALGPYVTAQFGVDEQAQRAHFDAHVVVGDHQIVRVNGSDAGFLSYERRADHVWLSRIALLPRFQSRGVGSMLIRRVLSEADDGGVPVYLRVLRSNPRARDLYARFGFRVTDETPDHVMMARAPRPPG